MKSDIPQFHAILNRVVDEKDEARRRAADESLRALRQQVEIERLRAELAAAIKERDEARRWLRDACAEIARIETRFYDALPPQQIAERNGWQCFAQQEGGGA